MKDEIIPLTDFDVESLKEIMKVDDILLADGKEILRIKEMTDHRVEYLWIGDPMSYLTLLSNGWIAFSIKLESSDFSTWQVKRSAAVVNSPHGCTLSDQELIDKCEEWIDKLIKDHTSWVLSIPARPNHDPDLLFSELIERFKKKDS